MRHRKIKPGLVVFRKLQSDTVKPERNRERKRERDRERETDRQTDRLCGKTP